MANRMDTIKDTSTHNRFSSRKFITLIVVWATSLALGWFKPDFVGNAQTLFNFWIFILGLYFGGNVAERFVGKRK